MVRQGEVPTVQMSEWKRFRQAPDVVACKLDDGNALLDLASGDYYRLNGTGSMIWECIGEGLGVDEIAESGVSDYDVGYGQGLNDGLANCNDFITAGLGFENGTMAFRFI